VLLLVLCWSPNTGCEQGVGFCARYRESVLTDGIWLLWLSWARADHVYTRELAMPLFGLCAQGISNAMGWALCPGN
jgi:hypothetical protein